MAVVQKSWVASGNDPASDFPIQNLPYGVFRHEERTRIGIAIGDQILDLGACVETGLLSALAEDIRTACRAELLNSLMSLGPEAWSALRREITSLLADSSKSRNLVEPHLIPV